MTALTNTEFISGTTITSAWLNGVNDSLNNVVSATPSTVSRNIVNKMTDLVSVKDFGAVGDGVTDDTVAINAAFAAFKTAVAAGAGSTLLFPPGKYKVTNSVGALDIVPYVGSTTALIEGYGAQILVDTADLIGKVILDLRGSTGLQVNGLQIYSEIAVASQPAVGIAWGRYSSTLPNNADKIHFYDIKVSGNYSIAAGYNSQSEINCYTNCQFLNSTTTSTAYAFILDGINHFNVSSNFATVTLAVDTLGSLQTPLSLGCTFQANAGAKAAIWISSAVYGAKFIGGYCLQQTANPLIELYVLSDLVTNGIHGLTLDELHCEGTNATCNFLITGPSTLPKINNLEYIENVNFCSTSIFKRDATQVVTITGLTIKIGQLYVGALPIFDNSFFFFVDPIAISLPASYTWKFPSNTSVSPADTNVAITSTASFVMAGFGADTAGAGANPVVFTPRISGKVRISFTGVVRNNTALSGAILRLQQGTGAAPALNAASAGTVRGKQCQAISATANAYVPFHLEAIVEGLSLGTQIWVDLGVRVLTSGNVFVFDGYFTIEEIK